MQTMLTSFVAESTPVTDRNPFRFANASFLCPETKTEMTQAEVSSHFLNICTEEVVPMFTFPTPLDDPKFHEGQRCLTVVASVIRSMFQEPGITMEARSVMHPAMACVGFSSWTGTAARR